MHGTHVVAGLGVAALVAGTAFTLRENEPEPVAIVVQQQPSPTPTVPKPDMPDEAIEEYRRQAPDLPLDELYRRINLPRALLLKEFAREETFAGSWYDMSAGLWHLLGTDKAVLDTMAAKARAKGIDPAPRVVEYSFNELDERALRIRQGKDPISRYSRQAGFDVKLNRVTVVASPPPRGVSDPMVVFVDS